jgi:hypothetical protein
VDYERLIQGLDRLLAHVGEIALVREALQQIGPCLGRDLRAEPQRACVLSLGLTVSPD